MKNTTRILFLLFITGLLPFVIACNSKNSNTDSNQEAKVYVDYCDYELLDSIGKTLIPDLIDSISINKKSDLMGYYDPKMSRIEHFQINNYIGIFFALDIEYILGLNYLTQNRHKITEKYMCSVPLYEYGVIVRNFNDSIDNDTLHYSDVVNIQQIYRNWWELNKNRPLDSLQKDWDNNIRPLNKECGYCWR